MFNYHINIRWVVFLILLVVFQDTLCTERDLRIGPSRHSVPLDTESTITPFAVPADHLPEGDSFVVTFILFIGVNGSESSSCFGSLRGLAVQASTCIQCTG